MKFFNPTGLLKELQLLEHIEDNPRTTQKAMSMAIDGAVSMVNVYIDNLEKEGCLKRNYKSAKDVEYKITSKGIRRKNYLLVSYLEELMKTYSMAKENMEEFVNKIVEDGYKDIYLYGAGEVAEVILSVINSKDIDLNILGIIDDDIKKHGDKLLGKEIISIEKIEKEHDGILITSYTYEEEILKRLKSIDYDDKKILTFFTKFEDRSVYKKYDSKRRRI